jgi:putative membrane protein
MHDSRIGGTSKSEPERRRARLELRVAARPVTGHADRSRVPAGCLAVFVVVWLLCAVAPRYRADWLLENLLTFVAVPLLLVGYRYRRFSDRAYVQFTVLLILHAIGSHYTYSEVPLGEWMRVLGFSRNHYDRLVHFAFGALMVQPAAELFLRGARLGRLRHAYLCFAVIASCSFLYEILEWAVAITADPAAGTAYLGTQGDVWDSQKDMALAGAGAILALFTLPRALRSGGSSR